MLTKIYLIFLLFFKFHSLVSCNFIISNNCPYTIWPGTLAGAGTSQLLSTGFRLDPSHSARLAAPLGWSGRIWGRTGCEFDGNGVGFCATGDCGGKLQCAGAGAAPPTTLFEITLGTGQQMDFYDVSLVDGYNLPLFAAPRVRYGTCNFTSCTTDLNSDCPKELQVVDVDENGEGGVVACRSACDAFGLDQYCCSGKFASPSTCKPSNYSSIFKNACPNAYSYAFDDRTSTFTCKAQEYIILFCPNYNRGKRSDDSSTVQPMHGEPSEVIDNGEEPQEYDTGDGEEPPEMISSSSIIDTSLFLILFLEALFQ
ncbi:pathogenesis-related protein 5-like isoform X1 [Phalaenopsis equestris]|uniref:pathogenesis-related protein 5-like isoform X1 n=2 Tax=Phalaenopsis equestris TaxID=78828 RepID=UPI0009E2D82C|nr:pathogenesis-related protein 5-like isoform X1 [Phalaenopsis equestris]